MADEVKPEGVAVVGNSDAKPAASGTPAPSPAPVTAPKAADTKPVEALKANGLEVKDEYGNSLGFTLDVAPASGQGADNDDLASRVRGWTPFKVDGEDYPYSADNARKLVARFPHIREQVQKFGE